MKKILILLMITATDSFASGISGGTTAPCDNDTLSKYTGTANIEINWEPNVIGLRWSNGAEQINGQSTCTYDGTITVPPQPTKLGYTFKGWKVDHSCGLKNVDTTVNATHYCYKNLDGSKNCFEGGHYDLTENGTYAVVFNYGTILGEALCSSTGGSELDIGTPNTNTTGENCWCRITGYVWPEGGICSTTSGWVREPLSPRDIANGVPCSRGCADVCSYRLYVYNVHRTVFYNSLPE